MLTHIIRIELDCQHEKYVVRRTRAPASFLTLGLFPTKMPSPTPYV